MGNRLQQRYQGYLAKYGLACLVLFGLFCTDLYAAQQQSADKFPIPAKSVELFDSMQFRGSLKAFQAWKQLVVIAQQQMTAYASCSTDPGSCNAAARSWQQMLTTAQKLAPFEQLKWVNLFFNRWPYRLDLETYGLSDYWASPNEFMRSSGDCEDYAISKYFALRQLGYPAMALRIVVVKDNIRNLGHAVLAVYQDEQFYVMDNMSDLVLPQHNYKHYQPQYSVNELYRWAHIRKFKKFSINSSTLKGPENAK